MKRVVLLIILIGVVTSVTTAEVRCEWAINIGDSIDYIISKSNLSINEGSRDFDYSGMSLNYTKLSEEDSLTIQVTDLTDEQVNYTITAEECKEEDNIRTESYFHPRRIFHWRNIVFIAAEMVIDGELSTIRKYGLPVTSLLHPFFPSTESIKEFFQAQIVYFSREINSTTEANVVLLNTSSESESEIMYEWHIKGTVEQSDLFNYEFSNHAQFVYEKSTGILLACRLAGFVRGAIDGVKITLTADYIIEQQDYTIPPNEYPITYPAQISLVLVSFFFGILIIQENYRKRK